VSSLKRAIEAGQQNILESKKCRGLSLVSLSYISPKELNYKINQS